MTRRTTDYPESVKPLDQFRGPALDEAMAYYKQAHDCDPEWTPARNALRIPPQDEARLKEAIDHYRQAVRLEPQFALAHGALGQALLARREFTEAEAEIRRGLDLVPEGEKSSALTSKACCSAASACAPWKVVSPPSSRERTGPPPPTASTWRNSVSSRTTTPRPHASMPRRSRPRHN